MLRFQCREPAFGPHSLAYSCNSCQGCFRPLGQSRRTNVHPRLEQVSLWTVRDSSPQSWAQFTGQVLVLGSGKAGPAASSPLLLPLVDTLLIGGRTGACCGECCPLSSSPSFSVLAFFSVPPFSRLNIGAGSSLQCNSRLHWARICFLMLNPNT